MRLGDLVGSGPFSCGPDTTLSEAAVAMADSDLGSLAVVEGTTLLGLVTERDLRNAVARGMDLETATVSDVMGVEPDTFDPDLDVWDAAAWIAESGYRHLPVVDDEGRLLGVVSLRDLLKSLVDTV
ncbi:MAG: CBS domain-containing protein [Acidimicrobiales bacterium]|jgi:CBS domain-containing protein|nr:CBS domain-containing protein [Acidimicrobiales bacterium]HLV91303.1 CBS domain-containing protein [Acidimicrobiia bacterium]